MGDTITHVKRPCEKHIDGFEEVKPMVFAGVYPIETEDFEDLRASIEKLQLNDASLTFEAESSAALGFGFRCGFLGMLHMEIIQERIERAHPLPQSAFEHPPLVPGNHVRKHVERNQAFGTGLLAVHRERDADSVEQHVRSFAHLPDPIGRRGRDPVGHGGVVRADSAVGLVHLVEEGGVGHGAACSRSVAMHPPSATHVPSA